MMNELRKRVVEVILDGELTRHLGYPTHDPVGHGTGNSRNGYSAKKVQSKDDELELEGPIPAQYEHPLGMVFSCNRRHGKILQYDTTHIRTEELFKNTIKGVFCAIREVVDLLATKWGFCLLASGKQIDSWLTRRSFDSSQPSKGIHGKILCMVSISKPTWCKCVEDAKSR